MASPVNNYAVMAERARALFLGYDQAAMCARLGLTMTETEIPVRFLGTLYRVRRKDGAVFGPGGEIASFNAGMAIYDAICRVGEPPRLAGEFVPTSALHGIRGTHSVHEDLHAPAARRFAGRAGALERALTDRGGKQWGKGDVSYIVDVFDFFPVCVRFWDADEEFPASLQFLWDANALDFLYYETLWYVMDELIGQLTAAI